jgi:hypothetical protein
MRSFAHADEPQSPPAKGIVLVETDSVITDSELNLGRRPFELHAEVAYTAVLNRILQGFLQYPEQAKRNFLGHSAGHAFVSEVNLYFLLFGELSTKAVGCHRKAQIVKLRGMQAVR